MLDFLHESVVQTCNIVLCMLDSYMRVWYRLLILYYVCWISYMRVCYRFVILYYCLCFKQITISNTAFLYMLDLKSFFAFYIFDLKFYLIMKNLYFHWRRKRRTKTLRLFVYHKFNIIYLGFYQMKDFNQLNHKLVTFSSLKRGEPSVFTQESPICW